jgi:hypothetical protein
VIQLDSDYVFQFAQPISSHRMIQAGNALVVANLVHMDPITRASSIQKIAQLANSQMMRPTFATIAMQI